MCKKVILSIISFVTYLIVNLPTLAMDRDDEDSSPMKYPSQFVVSKANMDRINSKKKKEIYFDKDRGLYYTISDEEVDTEAVRNNRQSSTDSINYNSNEFKGSESKKHHSISHNLHQLLDYVKDMKHKFVSNVEDQSQPLIYDEELKGLARASSPEVVYSDSDDLHTLPKSERGLGICKLLEKIFKVEIESLDNVEAVLHESCKLDSLREFSSSFTTTCENAWMLRKCGGNVTQIVTGKALKSKGLKVQEHKCLCKEISQLCSEVLNLISKDQEKIINENKVKRNIENISYFFDNIIGRLNALILEISKEEELTHTVEFKEAVETGNAYLASIQVEINRKSEEHTKGRVQKKFNDTKKVIDGFKEACQKYQKDLIAANKEITELKFRIFLLSSKTLLPTQASESIVEAVRCGKTINLSDRNINDNKVSLLKLLVELPGIYSVDLSNNDINYEDIKILLGCPTLIFLNLSNIHMPNEDTLRLLMNSGLKSLVLKKNGINDEKANCILQALEKNQSLLDLDLSDNNISARILEKISLHLTENKKNQKKDNQESQLSASNSNDSSN